MALKTTVLCLIFIYVLIGFDKKDVTADSDNFKIYPEKSEYIINATQYFELKCEGKEEIAWSTPKSRGENVLNTSTISQTIYSHELPFASILEIYNASYADTGYYYCGPVGQDIFKSDGMYGQDRNISMYRVAKIYLYVSDDLHLALRSDIYLLNVNQLLEVVFPCRPTSPDVKVDLYVKEAGLIQNANYTPQIGFKLHISEKRQWGLYDCNFFKGNQNETISFFLKKPPVDVYIATTAHTLRGEHLRFVCTVRLDRMWPVDDVQILTPYPIEGRAEYTNLIKHTEDLWWRELVIGETKLEDSGNYTCVISTVFGLDNKTTYVRVYDTDEHFLHLTEENDQFTIDTVVGKDPSVKWIVNVDAHPMPTVELHRRDNRNLCVDQKWRANVDYQCKIYAALYFRTHVNIPHIGHVFATYATARLRYYNIRLIYAYIQIKNITVEDRGFYTLLARNKYGQEESLQLFLNVSDIPKVNLKTKEFYLFEQTNIIKCIVTAYPQPNITWEFKNRDYGKFQMIPENHLEQLGVKFISSVIINSTTHGYVKCSANNSLGSHYAIANYYVTDPRRPTITATNMIGNVKLFLHEHLRFICKVSGIPVPEIRWYKDNIEFNETTHARILFGEGKQEVNFTRNEADDQGTYRCEAYNEAGREIREITVTFKDTRTINTLYWTLVFALGVVLITLIIILCVKCNKEKKLRRRLERAGFEKFKKVRYVRISGQEKLRLYDEKWEFPIEKLQLDKEVGAGAFGVVSKAKATGIAEGEDNTTVAVKMAKGTINSTYMRALDSELKIMIRLGTHINIVKLLGACTKNVMKGELLIILEYCKYGNLNNYLSSHRNEFINQVDSSTRQINFNIGSNSELPKGNYAKLSLINTTGSSSEDLASEAEENQRNYKGDHRGVVQPIYTKDLLSWALQVAQGMEYIASKKVIHCDLATRNVLLADNNVVKICDFGLAKSIYNVPIYKKKGGGPLPVKWMAIESIRYGMFSTQSDVWSYGMVLWELFSLAKDPYPHIVDGRQLYQELLNGYRLESPQFATKELHNLMLNCWEDKSKLRPSFTKLAERIGSILKDSERKHLINLNQPYLVMNTKCIGDDGYQEMFSPPDRQNIFSSSLYVNIAGDKHARKVPPHDTSSQKMGYNYLNVCETSKRTYVFSE